MQILSKNFSLPKNIKTINNSPTKQVSNPNFKSSKTKIAKELGNELTKHLQRENIKDILVGDFIKVNISMLEDGKRQFDIIR